MADALIKIGTHGPDPAWQDGDIIGIYPNCCILFKNAEIVCGANRWGNPEAGKLRPWGGLEQLWYERTHRWRHQRVSRTEIVKVDLWGLTPDEIRRPNGYWKFDPETGTRIDPDGDLDRLFARRLRNNTHNIFGPPGAETFYRGPIRFTDTAMGVLWDDIEPAIGRSRAEFLRMPFGRGDFKVHLCASVEDMTLDEATVMVKPEIDETRSERPILRRRMHFSEWEHPRLGLPPQARQRAKDFSIETDERDEIMIPKAEMPRKPNRG